MSLLYLLIDSDNLNSFIKSSSFQAKLPFSMPINFNAENIKLLHINLIIMSTYVIRTDKSLV